MRFNLVEVLLISVLVAVTTWGYTEYRSQRLVERHNLYFQPFESSTVEAAPR